MEMKLRAGVREYCSDTASKFYTVFTTARPAEGFRAKAPGGSMRCQSLSVVSGAAPLEALRPAHRLYPVRLRVELTCSFAGAYRTT